MRIAKRAFMRARHGRSVPFSILIPALERIGDKDAIHALISLLEQHGATSAEYELARPALVRLEKRCAPEQVESIRIALARFPAQ